MRKLCDSLRIKEIEKRWQSPLPDLLYRWHWQENLMHKEIGMKLDVPRPTVTRWFKKLGVLSQDSHRLTNLNLLNVGPKKTPPAKPKIKKIRPWSVNESFFDNWSPEMAYVLGFFCADGSMYVNPRGSHYLAFYSNDKDLLVKIKDLIGKGQKLSRKKRDDQKNNLWKPSWSIQIGSKTLFRRFLNLGITPRKANRIRIPKIPKQYIADFIRGYFDGDGSISYRFSRKNDRSNPTRLLITTFTSSSRGILEDIAQILYKMGRARLKMPRAKEDNSYELRYSTNDSRAIYRFIYSHPTLLFLERKKVVFEKYLGT